MRKADLTMAIAMAIVSLLLMWKSTELPIGWIADEGPGGGAFPFWLSAGMLISTLWIILRSIRRTSPPSRSTEPYMDEHSTILFLIGAGALTAMVGSVHFIGIYGAIPLFLIFHMRFIGHHSWLLTGVLAVVIPVVTFFFFEIALKITLPKGMTESLYYPLYDLFL